MLNCRIISINTDDEKEFDSVQLIGTEKDSFGKKTRYKKRRDNIKDYIEEFENKNINIEFFDAITPRHFSEDPSKDCLDGQVTFENKKFDLSKELWICYIGNFLSHYKIWNIDEDTLVLEDDVLLENYFFQNIPTIVESFKKIKEPNKILYLQVSAPWREDAGEKYFQSVPVNEHISKYLQGDISGTGAYFITSECKKLLLQNIKPISPCDNYLDTLRKSGLINYYIPTEKNCMCKLDTKTFLL